MDLSFPYTRYACPCSGTASAAPISFQNKRSSDDGDGDPEDGTFNPHEPRANYSLYPMDHLMFCDECNQIRCPKCTTEDMLSWFCPTCLFEVPTSGVKSEGNRCTRHCYECPLCFANLSVSSLNRQGDKHRLKPESQPTEHYIMNCTYCDWTSLDIGVSFNKPTKITEQLSKLWKAKHAPLDEKESEQKKPLERRPLHHDTAFNNLHKFYKEQLNESGDQPNPYSNSPYSSPANLARIVGLYGDLSFNALKKSREKPQPMREAGGHAEGLATFTANDDATADDTILKRMKTLGLGGLASQQQQVSAPPNYNARFTDELWPVATRLQVRKGKRCRGCRQLLVRPESKGDRLRYKIRLLSSAHIQRLSVRPLGAPLSVQTASFRIRPDPLDEVKLHPNQTQQYILTVRNPIFEPVKITLSTPGTTPGKVASRVTILCPSFTVDQSGDRWQEALSSSTTSTNGDGSRRAAMVSLTGSTDADRQPEAGKIWARHWNTTSVILEVIPGTLTPPPSIVPISDEETEKEKVELTDDDALLEIPIYVRVEWEGALRPHDSVKASGKEAAEVKEHRELAYWCVLGLGRITAG